MPNYLFRVEAVNMAPTIYDTADISTIRGAGFYLLKRVYELAQHPPNGATVITEGASTAVLEIDTQAPEQIRKTLLENLYCESEGRLIREMMFLVEYIQLKDENDFPAAMAALQGKLRLRQLQTCNIRLFPESMKPKQNPEKQYEMLGFDQLNRLLPAQIVEVHKGAISSFTAARISFGRDLRKEIYGILLKNDAALIANTEFTNDLEALSKAPQKGNLNGKIAFIYIDGNKFGKLQRDFKKEEVNRFDKELQRVKSAYLKAIIELAKEPHPDDHTKFRARIEILLWGGDEIKLIVPSWLGWRAALKFFEVVASENPHMEDKQMTYAMGLVFAHHNNPIRNISRLAEHLAKNVKDSLDATSCYQRDKGDRLHYLVLESRETLPSDYKAFCKQYYCRSVTDLKFSGNQMIDLQKFVHDLEDHFPRSRVFTLARTWHQHTDKESYQLYLDCLRRGLDTSEASAGEKEALAKHITEYTGAPTDGKPSENNVADTGHRWLQTAELWDYLTQ